jgi:hypothetical protein
MLAAGVFLDGGFSRQRVTGEWEIAFDVKRTVGNEDLM